MISVVDGVHDLGGMHGFGPVPLGTGDQAVFHEPWEGRVWAMSRVVMRRATIDRFRYVIEQMPAVEYMTSSYYERWLWAVERLAAEQGLLDGPEGSPAARGPSPTTPPWKGRFKRGDDVRIANPMTEGHCRVPRYLRNHVGQVARVACAWPNAAESASTGRYGPPELVYTIAFSAAELFGPGADHTLSADIAETDLEDP